MTGFARANGAFEDRSWSWEVKSVNGRGLEVRSRLPQGFDFIEPDIRKAVQKALHRGSLSVNLTMQREATDARYRVNNEALSNVLTMVDHINMRVKCDLPRAESILALRGVLEPVEDEPDDAAMAALGKALLASFDEALKALADARKKEGKALSSAIADQLTEIEKLNKAATKLAATAPKALRDKIAAQLETLLAGAPIPEERLAQEAALLAVKADVREELDRLTAHIEGARALLKEAGPVGRSLDFLTQEFNREANTLCSKASDMTLKQIGLDLKKTIDQMREQVQNVE